jgi:hypothetical protein
MQPATIDELIAELRRDHDAAMKRLDDIARRLDALQQTVDAMRPATVDPRWLASMARRSMRWRGGTP